MNCHQAAAAASAAAAGQINYKYIQHCNQNLLQTCTGLSFPCIFRAFSRNFMFLSFRQTTVASRGIMFLSCSRVLPSVRVTTLVNKIFWEWMNQFWCNFPQVVNGGKTIKQSTSGVRRSIVTVTQHRNRSQKSLSAQHLKNYSTNFSQTRQTRITVNAHYCVTTIRCKRSKIT